MPFSRRSSQPRNRTQVSCVSHTAGRFFTQWAIGEAQIKQYGYVSPQARERQIYHVTYMWNQKKWYKWTYLQNKNRPTDIEIKFMVAKRERWGKNKWGGGINIRMLLFSWRKQSIFMGGKTILPDGRILIPPLVHQLSDYRTKEHLTFFSACRNATVATTLAATDSLRNPIALLSSSVSSI